jgi:hypothetical protein
MALLHDYLLSFCPFARLDACLTVLLCSLVVPIAKKLHSLFSLHYILFHTKIITVRVLDEAGYIDYNVQGKQKR